jgi:RNase P/RNase MRP subunit POP5
VPTVTRQTRTFNCKIPSFNSAFSDRHHSLVMAALICEAPLPTEEPAPSPLRVVGSMRELYFRYFNVASRLEEVSKLLRHKSVTTRERHYAKLERQDRLDSLMSCWREYYVEEIVLAVVQNSGTMEQCRHRREKRKARGMMCSQKSG